MTRERYETYIWRFNAQDLSVFEEFLSPRVRVLNGTLELLGREAVQAHYARIWHTFRETLDIERWVADGEGLAVQMRAHFQTLRDDPASPFGPVAAGECFDFEGIVLYRVEEGRFSEIRVAYNRFTRTDREGRQRELGIPH
ncbi:MULTISPECIES: nuclear transport factor 2 family protein [unclassified Meiothermus]|uniref:nuclear transport factor 2 family protein n=1 Tax=unclassified Meiothermus TaxID=370471 RepID=UPI000D7C7525|nr:MULTISPECIES: nuclear transport factor 2 family protein [unclassified Meiothermus]PZA07694.1 nuclear transport factor 2 family protein [Meiothermus sp. Pnk-1]RYM34494.1 nuclear transport factor 2 family protein [Meiothermus sp. PNK-Is4]